MGKTRKKGTSRRDTAGATFWDAARWAMPVFVAIFLVMLTIFLVPVIEIRAEIRHWRAENVELKNKIETQQRELDGLKQHRDIAEMLINSWLRSPSDPCTSN